MRLVGDLDRSPASSAFLSRTSRFDKLKAQSLPKGTSTRDEDDFPMTLNLNANP